MTLAQRPFFAPVYMFVVTAVCTSVLVGLATWAGPRIDANRRFAFEQAVLAAFDMNQGTAAERHQRFLDRFEQTTRPGVDTIYILHDADDADRIAGYGLPFEGRGFWAPIRGIIALDADGRTLRGLAFYEQTETPGLGAEIVKPYFRDAFRGKILAPGRTPIRLIPAGRPAADNEIHAITGATQTCTRLENILNDALRAWLAAQSDRSAQPHEPPVHSSAGNTANNHPTEDRP